MNTLTEVGKRIKKCREEKGLTQEELGISLGLNKSTIQRYETGKISRIKLPVLEAIAEKLSVNPDYLALKTDDPTDYKLTDEWERAPYEVKEHLNFDPKAVYNAIRARDEDGAREEIKSVRLSGLSANEQIVGLSTLEQKNIRIIPLYKSVSAGFGAHADDYVIGYEPVYIESDYDAKNSLAIVVKGDSMYPKIESGDIIIVHKQSDFDNGDIIVVIPLDGTDSGFVKRAFLSKDKLTLESINNAYPSMEFEGEEMNSIHVVGVVKKIIKSV